jgi:type I restriction enzyme S subunit
LGKADIDRFRIVVPTSNVAKAFSALCQRLYDRIVAGKQAMRTLGSIRDTLLPRLISGKLRLPQGREQAQEAHA